MMNSARQFKRRFRRVANWLTDRVRGLPAVQPHDLTPDRIAAIVARERPLILEIGCNDGQDTVRLLEAMPGATIHCFEPDPRPIARFKKRLGGDQRVHLHSIAVGGLNGEFDFHTSGGSKQGKHQDWDLSGSLRKPKEHLERHPWVTFDSVTRVPCMRLDDWCLANAVGSIDFIWMDTQGAEADVIAGGTRALATTRFIYTEYSNDELYDGQRPLHGLLEILPDFEVVSRYPGDVLLKNRRIG